MLSQAGTAGAHFMLPGSESIVLEKQSTELSQDSSSCCQQILLDMQSPIRPHVSHFIIFAFQIFLYHFFPPFLSIFLHIFFTNSEEALIIPLLRLLLKDPAHY